MAGSRGSFVFQRIVQITEDGREPSYAFATMNVSGMAGAAGTVTNSWTNASLFWKAADRGQQTQAFHTDEATGRLTCKHASLATIAVSHDMMASLL